MSYNITMWNTIKLENLRVPLDNFHGDYIDLVSKSIDDDGNKRCTWEIGVGKVEGVADGSYALVNTFELYGEFSGTIYNSALDEFFENSTGLMEAVIVWEGGDSISGIEVKDGVITECEVVMTLVKE